IGMSRRHLRCVCVCQLVCMCEMSSLVRTDLNSYRSVMGSNVIACIQTHLSVCVCVCVCVCASVCLTPMTLWRIYMCVCVCVCVCVCKCVSYPHEALGNL